MSLGEVITRAFTDVDSTPQDGHAAAVSSAVTTCTTRVPSAQRSTRSTRTPGSPNNNVVPSDTALGSFLPPEIRKLQTSEDQGPPPAATESLLATVLSRLEAEHGDPLAALDHITLGIRNFYDSGNVAYIRFALATLAVLLDRLGCLEPAATIAGFAFNPL